MPSAQLVCMSVGGRAAMQSVCVAALEAAKVVCIMNNAGIRFPSRGEPCFGINVGL